jgi:hypothetical protein
LDTPGEDPYKSNGETSQKNIIEDFSLKQNYPNPFNPSTRLSFVIGHQSFVTLKIFDVLGNEIAVLINEEKPAGKHNVEFSVSGIRNLASGIYFYKLQTEEFSETKKMILMK